MQERYDLADLEKKTKKNAVFWALVRTDVSEERNDSIIRKVLRNVDSDQNHTA
jgi:hypothetical protein